MLAPQYEFDPYKTHIECFLFKSLHYLQAYTKNLLHMEGYHNHLPTKSHVELEEDTMQSPFQNTQLEEVNYALIDVPQNP